MSFLRVLILFLLCLFVLSAQAYKNEPDGFRGYAWGDDLKQHAHELTLVDDGGRARLYKRVGDRLQIGGADLEEVLYAFGQDNLLESVMVQTKGYDNQSALIDAFKAQFGRPKKPNRYIERYLWSGSTATIMISCRSVRESCVMIMQSEKMKQARELKEAAAAAKAKDDF